MIKILVFSRDTEWFGGVVNFIELLRKNLSADIQYTQFKIGRRKGVIGKLFRVLVPLLDSISLIKILRKQKFDAYHLNPSLNLPSLIRDGIFLIILRIFKVNNVLVSFHGWDIPVENVITKYRLFHFLFIKLYGGSDHIFVLAENFKIYLVSLGINNEKIHLFTTMFDSDEFSNQLPESKGNCRNLLFLSRLVKEKGIYEVLEAYYNLSMDYPDVRLVIAGNGDEDEGVERFLKDKNLQNKVELAGYVRDKAKVKVFESTGIFVLPTYYGEGCPVSLLEAMAAGHAVITTPVGGIPQIIENEINGLLLEKVTVGSVERAIRKLLENNRLRNDMSKANHAAAWKKYNASIVAQYFEKFYRNETNKN